MRYPELIMFRCEPEMRKAIEDAAEADGRPVGNLVRLWVMQRLRDEGYLQPPAEKKSARRGR